MGAKIPQDHDLACAQRHNDSNKSIALGDKHGSEAQRVRRAPQKRAGTASRRAPFCACFLEAQRVRRAPQKRAGTALRRAPFCACSLEAQRVRRAPQRGQGLLRAALRFARIHEKGATILPARLSSARAPFGRWPWPQLFAAGWADWLVIAVLEDEHLYPLAAELLGGRAAGHVDIDVVAVHLRPGVFNRIVARVAAGAINSDAGVQRQCYSISSYCAWLRPFSGSAQAFHRISSGDEITDGRAAMRAPVLSEVGGARVKAIRAASSSRTIREPLLFRCEFLGGYIKS